MSDALVEFLRFYELSCNCSWFAHPPFSLSLLVESYLCLCSVKTGGASGKEPASQCRRPHVRDAGLIPGSNLLEEEMATHSTILAWRIPWTEEPGGLKSTVVARSRP